MTKKSLRKYSKKIVDGVEQAPSRAMLRAVGFKEGILSYLKLASPRHGVILHLVICI